MLRTVLLIDTTNSVWLLVLRTLPQLWSSSIGSAQLIMEAHYAYSNVLQPGHGISSSRLFSQTPTSFMATITPNLGGDALFQQSLQLTRLCEPRS